MNTKITTIIKKLLPNRLYPIARNYLHRKEVYLIRKYYSDNYPEDIELLEALEGLKRHGFMIYPYEWADNTSVTYRHKFTDAQVFTDEKLNLQYTILDNRRLYFPKTWTTDKIREYFGFQEIEQHPLSPHRYLSEDFVVDENSIVVDCGVAEGNFGLSIIDKCKKLYLFEPEEQWMEPLKATFAPWIDKVVIVQKYLSDTTDEMNITLDDYFADKEYPNFIKLDVEGYEEQLLLGANKILSSPDLKKVVTCIYHKAEDEEVLGTLLQNHGFTTSRSSGYMAISPDDKYPYLRHGVIRATKSH